jgi:hypothetical protein
MRITSQFGLVAALAVTSFGAAPPIASAMECSQLCRDFMAPSSLTASSDEYDCQDKIDDTGGNCTIRGKRNVFMVLPPDIELDAFNMPIRRGGTIVPYEKPHRRNGDLFTDYLRVR